MKKEELMKLDGMTEELATKIASMSADELKDMIPRTRLNEVITERDNAKKEHEDVLKQLGALQKDAGDVETLKKQILDLQETAKNTQKTHEAEIHQLRVDNAVESALVSAKALNTKAVKALLNGLEKAEFDDAGQIKGLAEQIKALQSADDSKFLFGSSKATMKGAKTGESGNEDGDHGVDTSKMTYSEMVAYMTEHPDAKI